MVESKREEEVTVEEKRRGASEERGETGSAWQQASPPPPVTNAPIRATTSASRGLNYFLIRSFQASLTGPCIMPHSAPYACWTLNTLLPPLLLSRHLPPPPPPRAVRPPPPPRNIVPREELRVRDCEAYSTQTRGSCLDPLASDSDEFCWLKYSVVVGIKCTYKKSCINIVL